MKYVISRDGEETVYDFEDVFLFIGGVEVEDGFIIDTMLYIFDSNRNRGFGTAALKTLKEHYHNLYVKEVMKEAAPFWDKMLERNIINKILSCYVEPIPQNK